MRTYKDITDILLRVPENSIFLTSEDFSILSKYKDYLSGVVRDELLAELYCRCFLYGNNIESHVKELLISISSEEEFNDIRSKLLKVSKRNSNSELFYEVIEDFSCSDSLKNSIKNHIIPFFKCDGIIPVVYGETAIPLPFTLQPLPTHDRHKLIIEDSAGNPIPEWQNHLSKLEGFNITGWKIIITVRFSADMPVPTGDSLRLPVLIAIRRKEGKLNFPPLSVIFTGTFDVHGNLAEVTGIIKKASLAEKMNNALFFYPSCSEKTSMDCAVELDKYLPINSVEKKIKDGLVEKGLDRMNWREAKQKLNQLNYDVQYRVISLADYVLPLLDNLESVFRIENKDECLLTLLSLRGAVFCHIGRTEESLSLNRQCLDLAKKTNQFYEYGKILAHQIVNYTDFGMFDDAVRRAEELYAFIENSILPLTQKEDLQMRYYGSLGQVYLFRLLSEGNSEYSRESLKCFNTALIHAENNESVKEYVQDLNYIHLWYAVNAFGTPEEEAAYDNAYNAALTSGAKERNLGYLFRQKAYGAYRDLLLYGNIYEGTLSLPNYDHAEKYTYALTLKYKAALSAAAGDFPKAVDLFRNSLNCLSSKDNQLLYLINMTTAVQAWNSLKDTGFGDFAEECFRQAYEFFSYEDILKTYKFAGEWKVYLKKRGEGKENPQLKYLY